MAWSLRRPEPDEAAALNAVVRAGFETYRTFAPEGWEPPEEPDAVDRLRAQVAAPAAFALAAYAEGELAGHVLWVPADAPSRDGSVPDIHFRSLFLLEPYWGSGLAHELHTRAIEAMEGRSARLFTPAGQGRARSFYERRGWELYDGPYFEARIAFEIVEYRRSG